MKKGVTLLEIIVVMIIAGIIAAIAVPNFTRSIDASRAQDAQNNLLAIYSAQINENARDGNFCTVGTCPDAVAVPVTQRDCTTIAGLNQCLGISISNSGNFTYRCDPVAGAPPSFNCTANYNGGNPFTMTLTGSIATPINLTGPYNADERNPRCTSAPGTCP